MNTSKTTAATLAKLEQALAGLPDERDIPNTRRAQDELVERREWLSTCTSGLRAGMTTLAELDQQLTELHKQQADLTAIRHELGEELLALPTPLIGRDSSRRDELTVSIRCIDGQFNLWTDAAPSHLPLFDKLRQRGYVAPARAPWNPMAALLSGLPRIEAKTTELQQRRDKTQRDLDGWMRETARQELVTA